MADGVAVTPGAGATIDTDELPNGRHAQRIKLVIGDDNADDGNLSSTNPMPVTGSLAVTSGSITVANAAGASAVNIQDGGNSITVDGTVAVSGTVTVASHAVTNAGTFVVQENGAALTSLQLLDDSVATVASAITTKGLAAVGTDGTNARIIKTDTNGELQIDVLSIAAGNNNIGDVDVASLPALPAGSNNIGDVDVLTLPALPAGTNNIGDVDVLTLPALPAGTNNIGDVDVLTLPGSAHDAAISGNPVRIAGRAATSDYTAVAAGDTADLLTTTLGKPVVYPFALPGVTWSYPAASGGITDTTGVTIKAAAGAGVRNYITCLTIVNGHATVGTDVQIRDGASGTVLYRFYAVAAGGGVREVFTVPLRGSTNTLLEVACGTTGSAVYVNAQGFTSAE